MTRPEDAVAAARAAAARARARGAYAEQEHELPRPELPRPELPLAERLVAWALPEPDISEVRSTRRTGWPITLIKRLLLRLLAQYHALLIAEQTRFNVNHLLLSRRLEARVAELEAEVAELRRRLDDADPATPRDGGAV